MVSYDNPYYQAKQKRRKEKRQTKRKANGDEVLMIFRMVLDDKKSSQIINEIKRQNPNTPVEKKHVERIMTGNCKVNQDELSSESFQEYIDLRQQVYEYWREKKEKLK